MVLLCDVLQSEKRAGRGGPIPLSQHLFNVTVLRICICEREYNDDDVVLLIKRADSVGLGQPRQTTEWFYEERPKCARTTMSTHPIVKNNCAQAELI